jgi:hypothetical protein
MRQVTYDVPTYHLQLYHELKFLLVIQTGALPSYIHLWGMMRNLNDRMLYVACCLA